MKRREKKQLLKLIKTLESANKMLIPMLEKKQYQEINVILADEQEAALSIGNRIEQLEGEGTRAVKILEEYCEVLWEITQTEESEQKKIHIETLSLLIKQEQDAVEAMEGRPQIVFLPYKASMWDCMETVWKAAQDDIRCDAYVVPIPYYDLKPDGSAGIMHYEANLFPSYVPTISYQNYDLKKEYPDIIYIHNPYDNCNRVTSIHPNFYCRVIKNYTDQLVYIPYYLTGKSLPETHQFLPAYLEVDKIILQNEEMIKEVRKDVPREKLAAIGSPKAERVAWMEKNKKQLDFPDEWKKKAAGKKVLLYNVSISGLLNDREKMLDKIEDVFHVISKIDGVILLWRPHPLLEATLNSMCGQLVERYHKLLRWFKKKNIGILDHTADPDMAVVFADAYIGEASSSMVDLFRVVNKPRLLLSKENFYQPTLEEMQSERAFDACIIGETMWFVTYDLQLLCKCELNNGKIYVIDKLPEVPYLKTFQYMGIEHYKNKLIFVPYHADSLCVYDIDTGSFVKHYFRREYVEYCFGYPILYQHYLYLTPMDYPAIVRFDLLTGEFIYFENCISDLMKQINRKEYRSPFIWKASYYENELFLASTWSNLILTFNMDNFQYNISSVGDNGNQYRAMDSDERYSWLIVYNSPKVVRWDRSTGETKEYNEYPGDFEAGELTFKNILSYSSEVYMISFHANHSCILDKKTGEIRYADLGLPFAENTFASSYYEKSGGNFDFSKKISENKLLMFSLYDDSFIEADIKNKKSRKIPLRINDLFQWELWKRYEDIRELYETADFPLSKFAEYIKNELFEKNRRYGIFQWAAELKEIDNTGEKIHQTIIAELNDK